MNISEVAAATGIPAKTIRYYEAIGLVSAPSRTASGYRHYDDDDVRALAFIRSARSLGFSIGECGTLAVFQRDKQRSSQDVLSVARAHLEELELRRHELDGMTRSLHRLIVACPGDAE